MFATRSDSFTQPNCHSLRRGAILPLVAIILPVLIVLMGFSVDLAYMQNSRMELRAATDAAARAAATKLSQTDDVFLAREQAKLVARSNLVAGAALNLSDSDILVGRSEPDASGRWIFNVGGTPPNSVRVLGNRLSGSAGGGVPLFFGSFIGQTEFEPALTATASFLNVDICLVLDRSSSMKLEADSSESGLYTTDPRLCLPTYSNSRWNALDGAVRIFVDTLRDSSAEEQVALVTYSSSLYDQYPWLCGALTYPSKLHSSLSTDLSLIEDELDDLTSSVWNGNTYIEAGMRTGMTALKDPAHSRKFANKVMIVLTDGYPTEGDTLSAANDCVPENIVVNTITFGDFANETLMNEVAQAGGGKHYHASTTAALEAVFRELAAEIAQITE